MMEDMKKNLGAGMLKTIGATGLMAVAAAGLVACSPPNENPAACNDVTPEDTAFGQYLDAGEIPTTGGEPFRFEVTDNHFDACDHISWLGLSGTTLPEGGEQDNSGFVVFFQDGDLVTDPKPVQMGAAPLVERNDADDQATVQFGHYAAPGEVVTMDLRVFTFNYVDGKIEVSDREEYDSYAQGRNQLNMAAGEVCSADVEDESGSTDDAAASAGSAAAC